MPFHKTCRTHYILTCCPASSCFLTNWPLLNSQVYWSALPFFALSSRAAIFRSLSAACKSVVWEVAGKSCRTQRPLIKTPQPALPTQLSPTLTSCSSCWARFLCSSSSFLRLSHKTAQQRHKLSASQTRNRNTRLHRLHAWYKHRNCLLTHTIPSPLLSQPCYLPRLHPLQLLGHHGKQKAPPPSPPAAVAPSAPAFTHQTHTIPSPLLRKPCRLPRLRLL